MSGPPHRGECQADTVSMKIFDNKDTSSGHPSDPLGRRSCTPCVYCRVACSPWYAGVLASSRTSRTTKLGFGSTKLVDPKLISRATQHAKYPNTFMIGQCSKHHAQGTWKFLNLRQDGYHPDNAKNNGKYSAPGKIISIRFLRMSPLSPEGQIAGQLRPPESLHQ